MSPTPRRGSSFAVDQRDCAAVVAIEGDLDLSSAPELKATLTELVREGSGRLVLDFSSVRFVDSTALSVLVGVQRRLGPDERLAIAGVADEVLAVFRLSGLAGCFRIFPTCDAALTYVDHEPGEANSPSPPPLTGDAALMLGIASTAMPFAQSDEDQVERWLRVLRGHGEAGVVLASLGVSDAPLREAADGPALGPPRHPDPVATVSEYAGRIASQRRAARTATTDVLLAVMHLYGATFDRALTAHGADIDELATRVGDSHPVAAS